MAGTYLNLGRMMQGRGGEGGGKREYGGESKGERERKRGFRFLRTVLHQITFPPTLRSHPESSSVKLVVTFVNIYLL